jgi:Zn-dependent peptidase ImmA (M78 family)
MRGLFISNDYCPFIVINRKDAQSAQIFSFIHELAHLFRKTESISNTLEFRKIKKIDKEEIFCNRVAAELLLPKNDFISSYYDKQDIDAFSEIYKVSTLAIFYRLKELNKIRNSESEKIEDLIRKESEDNLKKKKKATGGNYLNNMKDSNGDLFNKVVAKYYFENKVGYTEASSVLRFSVEDAW